MSEPHLKPLVAATNEGTVVIAHCNCMAGLGGACCYVGAIISGVEAGVRIKLYDMHVGSMQVINAKFCDRCFLSGA